MFASRYSKSISNVCKTVLHFVSQKFLHKFLVVLCKKILNKFIYKIILWRKEELAELLVRPLRR